MAAVALLQKEKLERTEAPPHISEAAQISEKFHTGEQIERLRQVEETVAKVSLVMQVHGRLAAFTGETKKRFDDFKSKFVGQLKGIFGRHDQIESNPVSSTQTALTELAESDPAGGVHFKFLRGRVAEATRNHGAKLGNALLDIAEDARVSNSDKNVALESVRELNDAGLLGESTLRRISARSMTDRNALREQLTQVEKQLHTIAQNESSIYGDINRPQAGNTLVEAMELQLRRGGLVSEASERLRKNYEQLVVQYDDMARGLERKRRELYAQLDNAAQLLGSAAYTPEPIVDLGIGAGNKILAVRACCQELEQHFLRNS